MPKHYTNRSLQAIAKDFKIKYLPTLYFASPKIEEEVKARCKRALLNPRIKALNDKLLFLCEKELRHSIEIPFKVEKVNKKVGYGVFATKNIPPLTFIGEYKGVVTDNYPDNPYLFSYTIGDRASRFAINAYTEGNFTRFINHTSTTPCLSVYEVIIDDISHVVFLSNQAIEAGAELSYTYGDEYWTHPSRPIICDL